MSCIFPPINVFKCITLSGRLVNHMEFEMPVIEHIMHLVARKVCVIGFYYLYSTAQTDLIRLALLYRLPFVGL